MAETYETTTPVKRVVVQWRSSHGHVTEIKVYDTDGKKHAVEFAKESDIGGDDSGTLLEKFREVKKSSTGFQNNATPPQDIKAKLYGHPVLAEGFEGDYAELENYGHVNPWDGDSYDRIIKARRIASDFKNATRSESTVGTATVVTHGIGPNLRLDPGGFWMDRIPVYSATTEYTMKGLWVQHQGSVYVKKSATASTGVTPGSANNTVWALLIDGTDGVTGLGGQQGAVKIYGPIYRRTNSSTAPARPTGGTVGPSTITAAPANWGTTQLQPIADNQYVYVSFALDTVTGHTWTSPILTAQFQTSTKIYGPIYRRTNSSTRPAKPTGGTISSGDIATAPDDWGTTQLQPTSDNQYVYVSYAFDTESGHAWTNAVLSAQFQAPSTTSHVKGDWDSTVTYSRGDIIISHGTLCILSAATSLNEAPETHPNTWIRIRNAAVPWRAASTYAFGEHVSQHGKLYVLKVTSATGIDPSLTNQTSWVQIGGEVEAGPEGILTRSSTELVADDELSLAPDINNLLLASASVPVETEGRFDDRIRIESGIFDSTLSVLWFTIEELDGLTASDTYSSSNSLLLFTGSGFTVRILKIANGNLVIRKSGGTGNTDYEIYVDHIYFTESMDRVQEALREIVGNTGGSSFQGVWSSGTIYNRGDTVLDSSALWILYGAANHQSSTFPGRNPLQWFRLGGVTQFSSSNTYRAGAIVLGSDNNVYICTNNANTATNPTTNPSHWFKLENPPAQVSEDEKTAGTEDEIRQFSPEDVKDMVEEHDEDPILTQTETQLVSRDDISLQTSTETQILSGNDLPAENNGRFDDRVRVRVGNLGGTLTVVWLTTAQLRGLMGNDGFNTNNAIQITPVINFSSLWLRRRGSGHLNLFRYGGTGTQNIEIHLDHIYWTESQDRVEEAIRDMIDNPEISEDRLLPAQNGWLGQVLTETSATTVSNKQWRFPRRRLPATSGQFGVYRRIEANTANATDLAVGRVQFYTSNTVGGAEATDRQTVGTSWNNILGTDASGLGQLSTSPRCFMLVNKTENRNKNLSAFFTQLGQNYWTYPQQILIFAAHDQWVLVSGNLIGNSAAIGANHNNFWIERVIDFNLDGTTRQSAIPYDLQIKWGFQGDNDTVLAQKVPHTRYFLGGSTFSETNRPTLADWDGSAFSTGNANQTVETPPTQDDNVNTHLWILTATSTRTAGVNGTWSTTAWSARRSTDPDSTSFSAQYSSTGTGGWTNNQAGIGNVGYMRFRLDNGDWFGPVYYGPLPSPPILQVEYSATQTGGYSSTTRTTGYFRFKLSTETTWAGPFLLASNPPTLQVQYSATETGTYTSTVRTTGWFRFKLSTETTWAGPFELDTNTVPTTQVQYSATETGTFTDTVRTTGYYRFKLSTETDWTGPFRLAEETTVTVPTLQVQYSATEIGTYTDTVRTEGFFQFRYNNGPWIGPIEIGATSVPTIPTAASILSWSNLLDADTKEITEVGTLYIFPANTTLDNYTEIEFGLGLSGADDGMSFHTVRAEEVEIRNQNSQTDHHHNVYLNYNSNEGLGCVLGRDPNDPLPTGAEHQCGVRLQFWRPFSITTGRRIGRLYVVGFTTPSTGTPILSLRGR